MEKGFRQVGSIWYQDVPRKHLRCLLIAKVQNAALSAIDAYAPSPVDYLRLGRPLAFYCRKAMAGAAHVEVEGRHCTLGTYKVLKHWQQASCESEATVCRLRWYQTVAVVP
ncbi:MAG: hypothetical protein ACKPKO_58920, partial [Candidatus Fonsibacter sp.]